MRVTSLTRRRLMATVAAGAALPALPRRPRAQASGTLRVRSNAEIQDIDPVNPAASADQAEFTPSEECWTFVHIEQPAVTRPVKSALLHRGSPDRTSSQ